MDDKKKKILIIVGVIVLIIIIGCIVAYVNYLDYLERLDGRDCLTCPYKTTLKKEDFTIVKEKKSSDYSSVKYKIELYTKRDKIKVDGDVTVTTSCKFNYCFRSSYINNCSWNYEGKSSETIHFNNTSSESDTITVSVSGTPTSIYSSINSINCDIKISEVNGTLLTYV